jgi:hypothetical protein
MNSDTFDVWSRDDFCRAIKLLWIMICMALERLERRLKFVKIIAPEVRLPTSLMTSCLVCDVIKHRKRTSASLFKLTVTEAVYVELVDCSMEMSFDLSGNLGIDLEHNFRSMTLVSDDSFYKFK